MDKFEHEANAELAEATLFAGIEQHPVFGTDGPFVEVGGQPQSDVKGHVKVIPDNTFG